MRIARILAIFAGKGIRLKLIFKKEHIVKKIFALLALMAMLACPVLSSAEETRSNPAGNPVDQFTGKYWLDTSVDNQKAYLFGIDSAIAVEAFIHNLQVANKAKAGKRPVYTLSPFEKGWMQAFKDVSRDDIAAEVTKWYKEHPQDLDTPVLRVIWYELVVPRLKQDK